MSADIVERLREWSQRTERAIAAPHRLCDEAANEITRLRAERDQLRSDTDTLNHMCKRFQHDIARVCARVDECEDTLSVIAGNTTDAKARRMADRALKGETE